MAIYTTFFLCKPEELLAGFPGWRLPLEEPVRREFRNPFTGELSVVETREPEWPDDEVDVLDRQYPIVAIEGRYEDYLEGRLPRFVRSCPHWAAKGLTAVELDPLLKAAGVDACLECAIYGPPSSGAIVQQLPTAFLAQLGSLDHKALARRRATAMSAPEHAHSVSGVKLSEGWMESEALEVLLPVVALAREATSGQRMYLLTEA